MASNYLSLDEAAKVLGLPADRLVEMRSQGAIRGFRDGASWKFPQDEIDRLLSESGINVLSDEEVMPGGSSILVSEQQVGSAIREGGSKIIGGDSSTDEAKSGVDLAADSDVQLVARQGHGSDVQVVASRSGAEREPLALADDDELSIAPEDESGLLDLGAVELKEGSTGPVVGAEDLLSAEAGGTGPSSDLDLQLHDSSADVLGDLDLVGKGQGGTDNVIRGDSDPNLDLGGIDDALSDDDDLVIADDDDDDLILSGVGSDISIAGDSGINLMSPSDSGLSLESEPLDLAGSSISALDLGGDAGASPSSGGSGGGSGSLVDFQSDEEFQLSPSGVGLEAEDDSGSQVIEVEDSAAFVGEMDLGEDAFGGGSVVAGEGLLDGGAMMGDEGLVDEGFVDEGFVDEGLGIQSGEPVAVGGAVPVAYETPFSVWSVVALAGILLLMSVCGMLMTDLVRNLWTYSEPAAPVSSLTDALISMVGLE